MLHNGIGVIGIVLAAGVGLAQSGAGSDSAYTLGDPEMARNSASSG